MIIKGIFCCSYPYFNWNNWNNWNALITIHYSLLYKVFECAHQFVEHTECIAVDAEVLVDL